MSEPLEKLDPEQLIALAPTHLSPLGQMGFMLGQVNECLNAAIDRINELEAKYEGHTHHSINKSLMIGTTPPKASNTMTHTLFYREDAP